MKIVQKIVVAFVFILWSANVAAFDVEGISYEVLSENERTACVARQMFQTNWSAVCCYEFIKLNTSAWLTSDLMVPALTTDGISVECQVFT